MKKTNKILILLTAVASLWMANTSFALTPSAIYIFGDSLSDSGFIDNLGLPKGTNTFTTPGGLVWSQQLGKDYNLPATATPNNDYKAYNADASHTTKIDPGFAASQTEEGNCYAAGGATTSGPGLGMQGIYMPPSLNDQVANYIYSLTKSGGRADPNAVYIIWGGANNLLKLLAAKDTNPEDYAQAEQTAATDIVNEIHQLQQAGAQHIVVINLPDLSETALIKQDAKTDPQIAMMTHAVSMNYNTGLNNALAGQGVQYFDVFKLMNTITTSIPYTDPLTHTTITNATNAACDITQPNQTALTCTPQQGTDGYMFEDGIHPTALTHNMLAKHLEQIINAM